MATIPGQNKVSVFVFTCIYINFNKVCLLHERENMPCRIKTIFL